MDCSSKAKSTTSEEEDDVGAVSRDETGSILALVSLRFLDVRIHPKDATANPESRWRRSRGLRRERRGFAPMFLREGDQKVDDFTRLRSTIAVVAGEIEPEESSGRTRSAWLSPLRRNRKADAIKSSRRLRVPTSFGSSGRTRSAWLDPLRLIVYRHHWHERNKKKTEEHVIDHDKLGLSLCSSAHDHLLQRFSATSSYVEAPKRESFLSIGSLDSRQCWFDNDVSLVILLGQVVWREGIKTSILSSPSMRLLLVKARDSISARTILSQAARDQ